MRSMQYIWVAMLILAGLSGCAMCDNSQDSGYSAFGGKWQRDNPDSGRVASAFDPAGMQVIDSGIPTEAELPLEILEEEEETLKPLFDEGEDEEEADQAETPAMSGAEQAEEEDAEEAEDAMPDAAAKDGRKPSTGGFELPGMPRDSSKSTPRAGNADLLPPLEFAP